MTLPKTSEPSFSTGLEHHFVENETDNSFVPITIFYPCAPPPNAVPSRYVDLFAPSVDKAIAACLEHLDLDPKSIGETIEHAKSFRLNSFPGTVPDASSGPYPIILYSPGGEAHRFTNVPLLERIAAAGYVVVTIDHPAEASPLVDAHGAIRRTDPTKIDFIELTLQRVKDVRLVLDYLFGLAGNANYTNLLDTDRIGMFGHSRGGYVATLTQAEDSRIKAVGNIDGFLYAYWTPDGSSGIDGWPKETQRRLRESDAPFLRIRGRDNFENSDSLFQSDAKDFSGDFNFVILKGWSHDTFVTSPMFRKVTNASELFSFCSIGSDQNVITLSRMVVEFFDIYLKSLESRTYLTEEVHINGNALVKLRLMNKGEQAGWR